MAVTRTITHVGTEGQGGWNRTDVLNALETALIGVGHHGTQAPVTGRVTQVTPPGLSSTGGSFYSRFRNEEWKYLSPAITSSGWRDYRYFKTTNNGNSGFRFQEYIEIHYVESDYNGYWRLYYSLQTNSITTGQEVYYQCLDGTQNANIPLIDDGGTTKYYIRKHSDTTNLPQSASYGYISIHPTLTDAQNDTNPIAPIDAASVTQENNLLLFSDGSYSGQVDNETIEVKVGDKIRFWHDHTGHPFYIQDQSGAYNSTRTLVAENYDQHGNRAFVTGDGLEDNTVNGTTYTVWDTGCWHQGDFYYVCGNHPAMGGVIRLIPHVGDCGNPSNGIHTIPWWEYEVQANGNRSALKLRIYRWFYGQTYAGHVAGIKVMSDDTFGWSSSDTILIPGDQVGGVSGTDDIAIGVNSSTVNQQANFNAVASLEICDFGGESNSAGTGFFQKFNNSYAAIMQLDHDTSKTYGTTYWGIMITDDHTIYFRPGPEWKWLNHNPNSSTLEHLGEFGGAEGMDHSTVQYRHLSTTQCQSINFASSTNATDYPLKIITHKDSGVGFGDGNFATISFVQTVNAVDVPYATLFFHKGTQIGSGIWDLDDVWLGCWTQIKPETSGSEESIQIKTWFPVSEYGTYEQEDSKYALRREAIYGYVRDATSRYTDYEYYHISNNIYTDNTDYYSHVKPYFRDHTVDKQDGAYAESNQNQDNKHWDDRGHFYNSSSQWRINKHDEHEDIAVNSNADYYRPMSGIPLSNNFAPQPYYLPPDFVCIPFNVSPGATTFRPGDTISVDASEVYTIIEVHYNTNASTFTDTTCKGIAFCARTV